MWRGFRCRGTLPDAEEVAHTVLAPGDVEGELQLLISVLPG
jgi:hypothetical protein